MLEDPAAALLVSHDHQVVAQGRLDQTRRLIEQIITGFIDPLEMLRPEFLISHLLAGPGGLAQADQFLTGFEIAAGNRQQRFFGILRGPLAQRIAIPRALQV